VTIRRAVLRSIAIGSVAAAMIAMLAGCANTAPSAQTTNHSTAGATARASEAPGYGYTPGTPTATTTPTPDPAVTSIDIAKDRINFDTADGVRDFWVKYSNSGDAALVFLTAAFGSKPTIGAYPVSAPHVDGSTYPGGTSYVWPGFTLHVADAQSGPPSDIISVIATASSVHGVAIAAQGLRVGGPVPADLISGAFPSYLDSTTVATIEIDASHGTITGFKAPAEVFYN
jgi:hypothetical protein